jgi:hypothetical protein
MLPILSIEQEVNGAIAPDQAIFATPAEGSVEAAFRDPLVDGFDALQPAEPGEFRGRENRRDGIAEGAPDLVLTQEFRFGGHALIPPNVRVGRESVCRVVRKNAGY